MITVKANVQNHKKTWIIMGAECNTTSVTAKISFQAFLKVFYEYAPRIKTLDLTPDQIEQFYALCEYCLAREHEEI